MRKIIVKIHLYLAAFFTPMVLVMALSGGLYLFGIKGATHYEEVATIQGVTLNHKSPSLKQEVDKVLQQAGIDVNYEYVKVKGKRLFTRPTSGEHYRLDIRGSQVLVSRGSPNLQAMLMELHKGHGPGLFKWLEKAFAVALVLIMVSGVVLGLQSPLYKMKTLGLSAAGCVVFLVLAFL